MNRSLKKLLMILPCALLAASLAACTAVPAASEADNGNFTAQMFRDVDFANSPYKHINNGGVTDQEKLPYNIDAITGATQTVEGPGVKTSIPLSIREIESQKEGLVRGVYKDATGSFIYEGVDLYYMLTGMADGDSGIVLTDSAYLVQFKNHARETIAEMTVDEIKAAHEAGRPVMIAYGIGFTDGSKAAPFVFNAANEGEYMLGYVEELDNDDGCLKLVYDISEYGKNNQYDTFSNVAYIYLREREEPGFKHTDNRVPAYTSTKFMDYIIAFRGSALGREFNLTLRQLEALAPYGANGQLAPGGIGYSDTYSLANNAYWYVSEYEGLDLYKLLQYLGMKDAKQMGAGPSRTTLVDFLAADGVKSPESFSVETLSYPDAFGFYNKNSTDPGDGSYVSTPDDLIQSGYPVLLAYGVNNYPYTITKTDDGYMSGLSNSGGPMRVVFGKREYNHANGSNQIQYVSEIRAGEDILYNTHKYTDDPAHSALAQSGLKVTVTSEDGATLSDRIYTAGEIEDIVYGADVEGNVKKEAKVKDIFQVKQDGAYVSDIYEGINFRHFLMNVAGLQGTVGTVVLTGNSASVEVDLAELFEPGYNTELGRKDLPAILAFAKNGSPLVPDENSPGYVKSVSLSPLLKSDPSEYTVKNAGGPLMLILPSRDAKNCNAVSVAGITSIQIRLEPDAYAHIREPYNNLAQQEIRFYGDGLAKEAVYKVGDIENRQTEAKTLDYSFADSSGKITAERYRGISVYSLLTEIGLNNNAGEMNFHCADGTAVSVPLSALKKQVNGLFAILAYGKGDVNDDKKKGLPLVADNKSAGYAQAPGNAGGPLMLITPQNGADSRAAGIRVPQVTSVEVTANDIDTWGHGMSDMYSEFLDYAFTLTVKNDDSEWTGTFSLEQLESLKQIIVRESYTILDIGTCEGIDLWKFVKLVAGHVPGIDKPVAVTAYAEDGYKNDLLSVFYMEGLERGILDADGNRKPIILAYAVNEYPLVDTENHEGYTGKAGNAHGPLRVITETVQGASVKLCNKLVVTLPGSGAIQINPDKIFTENTQ